MLSGRIGVTFVYAFTVRKYYFRGQWSATPKNGGWSKRTLGWTVLKSGGSTLEVGTYLQEAVPPGTRIRLTHFYNIICQVVPALHPIIEG